MTSTRKQNTIDHISQRDVNRLVRKIDKAFVITKLQDFISFREKAKKYYQEFDSQQNEKKSAKEIYTDLLCELSDIHKNGVGKIARGTEVARRVYDILFDELERFTFYEDINLKWVNGTDLKAAPSLEYQNHLDDQLLKLVYQIYPERLEQALRFEKLRQQDQEKRMAKLHEEEMIRKANEKRQAERKARLLLIKKEASPFEKKLIDSDDDLFEDLSEEEIAAKELERRALLIKEERKKLKRENILKERELAREELVAMQALQQSQQDAQMQLNMDLETIDKGKGKIKESRDDEKGADMTDQPEASSSNSTSVNEILLQSPIELHDRKEEQKNLLSQEEKIKPQSGAWFTRLFNRLAGSTAKVTPFVNNDVVDSQAFKMRAL